MYEDLALCWRIKMVQDSETCHNPSLSVLDKRMSAIAGEDYELLGAVAREGVRDVEEGEIAGMRKARNINF